MTTLPEPYYDRDGITLYVGDNREVLPALDVTVSAVVTDPPYGLSFMGKDWDHSVPGEAFWRIIADAMKPGAHLLSFGGSRTYHRMGVAIEDAGLELRDTLMWLYGSGMPKSHDVSKAIESRLTIGKSNSRSLRATEQAGDGEPYQLRGKNNGIMGETRDFDRKRFTPATPEAEQWQGWGTALKPSFEPVILARKPLCGTVAANVLAHGTGALNIDACRIGTGDALVRPWIQRHDNEVYGKGRGAGSQVEPAGRWPANVILDEDAASALDAQSGIRAAGARPKTRNADKSRTAYGAFAGTQHDERIELDSGGASRFFKTVKHEENDRTYADFMVQYDCNCEAVEGDQWVKQDRNPSIQQDADTPPQRDTTATPSGTASEGAPCLHTSSSGSGTTGQSLTDTRYTTSTATSRTTGSKTCNCSTRQRTSASTQDANCAMANGGNPASSAASSSESTPNIGTSAKRDGRSTDGADNAISAKSLPINSGNAARFRYVAKASRAERRRGLPDDMDANHPTVKPLALMRYLVTLVTPPGGIVLDPFAGSGSTLVACAELGLPAIGIEMSEEYAEISARRIDHAINERTRPEISHSLPLGV